MGRRLKEHERTRIRELIGEGLSYQAVASAVGRSPSTIRWACRELGIGYEKRPWTKRPRTHGKAWGFGPFILPPQRTSFRYEECIIHDDALQA